MADRPEFSRSHFPYEPTQWASALGAAFFGVALLVHIWQLVHYKTKWMWVLIIAAILEAVGFITRCLSIRDVYALVPYVISMTCLVVSPAFLAAQNYMIIGRVMSYVGAEYGYINHNKITLTFVGADIFAIITQAGGGAMLGSAEGNMNILRNAQKLLLGGLALQVITFGIFGFVAIAFDVRSSRAPALEQYREAMRGMRKLWIAFYLNSALITARSVYRTIEFAEIKFSFAKDDATGYLLDHEWPMYLFDAFPILISIVAFSVWHPGQWLPTTKGVRIDGTYEQTPGRKRFICCGPRKSAKTQPEMGSATDSAVTQQRV